MSGTNTMSSLNVVPITVGCGYTNEPCVSVKICEPGTANCTVVNNILLDTGSFGLRIFSCAHSLNLVTETYLGHSVAECVSYADGSSDWGTIVKADVTLGTQTASNIPIQIIDATYPDSNNNCTGSDYSAAAAGFNGIIGVGLQIRDATRAPNGYPYYLCSNGACSSTSLPTAYQVQNPVAAMTTNNNGVIISMPSISAAGTANVTGNMYLGIDTLANNSASGMTPLATDIYVNFRTLFPATSTTPMTNSFIDSGSNFLDFYSSAIASDSNQFYIPATTLNLTAKHKDAVSATTSALINFQLMTANNVSSDSSYSYNNVGAIFGNGNSFDWGFPFFFGRAVAVQFEGKSSTNLGTSTYGLWGWKANGL
jgi:hypothetical protein